MDGMIAILRRCARCEQYRSIDSYADRAKVCGPCVVGGANRGNQGSPTRTLVITESGRELLAQWRAEETLAEWQSEETPAA